MLERILAPLDGSALSARILTTARRLLLSPGTEVLLARVVPAQDARSYMRGEDPGPLLEAARRELDVHKQALERQGARVDVRVVLGDPAAAVLRLAAEWRTSLMVLSTHGRTGVDRWIRGSVAESLLRRSPVPLFLANPFVLPADCCPECSCGRILVALDGSDDSAAVLPLVARLARVYDAEVVLFCAPELPLVADFMVEDVMVAVERDARESIERQRRSTLAHVRSKTEVCPVFPGRVADAILGARERCGADVVALTTHGRGGLARWYFGSVAERVLQTCRAPLLVQRTAALARECPTPKASS
jgi:nucleotide-binding universal stress UspA family protein